MKDERRKQYAGKLLVLPRMKKFNQLKRFLSNLESVVIAFSGGLDSGLIVKAAYEVLKKNAVAVTASSVIHSRQDIKEARSICKKIGIKHVIVNTDELSDINFTRNSPDRCYWCKRRLILELRNVAGQNNISYVLDGTNYDDRRDYRPGFKANSELGVISPLFECKFEKKDIVAMAKDLGLSFWNKPKSTCLASRIPFSEKITLAKIKAVEKAENILKDFLGRDVLLRARNHGDILRLEFENRVWTKLKKFDIIRITGKLKSLGFKYITVDLEGYIPSGKKSIHNL